MRILIANKLVSSKELAAILGLQETSIRSLKHKGVFKSLGDSHRSEYKLGESVRAYLAFRTAKDEHTADVDFHKERALREKVRREMDQISLARVRGQTHSSEDVRMVTGDAFGEIRSKVLAIPQALSVRLAGKDVIEIRALLDDYVREMCRSLKEYRAADFYNRNSKLIPWLTEDDAVAGETEES